MSVWKDIFGYEGFYQVSDDGQVRSLDRIVQRRDGRTSKWSGRLLSRTPNKAGYLQVSLCRDCIPDKQDVHSLVLRTFRGPRPKGTESAHGDGNKRNNTVANLRWATLTQNTADKERHGTVLRGELHGCAILSAMAVERIRDLKIAGFMPAAIAEWLNFSLSTVKNVFYGTRWARA